MTRSPIALVLFTALALVAAACGDDNDEVSAEFTGDDCVYSGPTEFKVGDEFEITVIDSAEKRRNIGFAVLKVLDGTTAAEVREQGISKIGEADRRTKVFAEVTENGTERTMSTTLDVAGTWLVNCFDFDLDRDFPATAFEVVEEADS